MKILLILTALFCICSCSQEKLEVIKLCLGNIETYEKKIIKTGVSYALNYKILDSTAKVRFAGRELNAQVEEGKSWKGIWIKQMNASPIGYIPRDGETYFSYLPDEGGVIKFQFESGEWFSGNCQ